MGKMKVMLDTSVFCRPFDDFRDFTIKKESVLIEIILELAEDKEIDVLTSDILYAELDLIGDLHKRDKIFNEIKSLEQKRISINDNIQDIADGIADFAANYSDSLYISFALTAKCDCFITCDKGIIKTRAKIERFLTLKSQKLDILTPEEFIEKWKQH